MTLLPPYILSGKLFQNSRNGKTHDQMIMLKYMVYGIKLKCSEKQGERGELINRLRVKLQTGPHYLNPESHNVWRLFVSLPPSSFSSIHSQPPPPLPKSFPWWPEVRFEPKGPTGTRYMGPPHTCYIRQLQENYFWPQLELTTISWAVTAFACTLWMLDR